MKKIILVQGDSPYNQQRIICGRIQTILQKKGYEAILLDRSEYPEEHIFIGHLTELQPDAVFTMELTGFECRTVGDDISYNGIPCLMVHFLSKAPWEYDILNRRYNFTMFFYCTEESYQRTIHNTYERIVNIGSLQNYHELIESPIPSHERSVEVYLPCTYEPSVKIMQQIEVLPDVFQKIAKYCINELESHPQFLFENVLAECLQKIEFICEPDELIEIMQELKCVPKYIKMHYFENLLASLTESQIRVSVSGQGWNSYQVNDKAYFHEMGHNGVSYDKCEEIMQNSKIVINYDRTNRIPVQDVAKNITYCLRNEQSIKAKHYNLEAAVSKVLQDMEL